jgi:hypothetical protein
MLILGKVVNEALNKYATDRDLCEGVSDTTFGKATGKTVVKMPKKAGLNCAWRRMTVSLY